MHFAIRIAKDLIYAIVAALIGSIVISFMLVLAISSIYQSPFVTLLVSLLFTPFHLSDHRRFFREGEWSLIALRFGLLAVISSFLVGLFRAALGSLTVDLVLPLILVFTAPILFALILTYLFFSFFFPNNSMFIALNRRWSDLVSGGKAYGIWWDY